jgi:anti-sigma regulatory factor (Ser/Thr protein kinase)
LQRAKRAYPDVHVTSDFSELLCSAEIDAIAERGRANAAGPPARVQAQVTTLLARLRDLEEQYGDQEGVFADLLDLDHRVSQMGRLADSFALLSGGRSGRRWTKPIVMESILRGAMGRISAYRRVRVHSSSTVAVAGYAAEGVMHTLAELMDNATTISAHGTEGQVYIEEEDTGVMVRIEDSGLGMRARERRRAEKLISEPLDLTSLSGTRLGLAVVGRLVGKYGLTVNFRPSSRGGTGVVVLIPHQLVTQSRQEVEEDSRLSVEASSAEEVPAAPETAVTRTGDGNWDALPKRRRGETLAAATRSMPPRAAAPARARRDPGTRFAAFHQAGGRGTSSRDEEGAE